VYVPVREHFQGPKREQTVWTLQRKSRIAGCEVWTHELGHELRLTISGDPMTRTHVCRSQEELISIQDEWRKALEETGWTAVTA